MSRPALAPVPETFRWLALLTLIALAASCSGLKEADREAEEKTIRDLDRKWLAAVAAKDTAAVAAFYAEDGVMMVPNGPRIEKRPAIQVFWADLFRSPNATLQFAPTDVFVAKAGDMAYELGTYHLVVVFPQGRTDDEGKTTVVWRKVGQDWKVAVDMFNSSRPLMAAPPAPAPTR
jgi:uncharacterized protein (TIGR02246 family)